VGLILIRERKLLLAFSRNKQAYYLPGGKTDPGELSEQALVREIREELNLDLNIEALEFYTHVSAPAFGEVAGVQMEQDCFIYARQVNPVPGAEIGSIRYFSVAEYGQEPRQAPGVITILNLLKADGLID
jgi:8-oxo-dGTP pyrophosphatase MutT (NUDIX family)